MATKDYEVGYKKPPKNRQFGQPEGNKRREGFWDINSTPRKWLENMMKMQEEELVAIYNDESQPLFRRKLARCIKDGDWGVFKEMVQEVYGKMPVVEIKVDSDKETEEEANKFIRGFCLP